MRLTNSMGLFGAGLLVIAVCQGCAARRGEEIIKTADPLTFFPSLRLQIGLLGKKGTDPTDATPGNRPGNANPDQTDEQSDKANDPFLFVEVNAEYAEGKDTRSIGILDEVELEGDEEIAGPADIDYRIRAFRLGAEIHARTTSSRAFQVEGIGGLSLLHLWHRAESIQGDISGDGSALGPVLGGQLNARVCSFLKFYARGLMSPAIGLDSDTNVAFFASYEFGASIRPLPEVGLLVGYRGWHIEESRTSQSDIKAHLRGPMIGAEFLVW